MNSLSIVEIILIFLAALAGTLVGLYIAFLIIKSMLYPGRKKGDCVHRERRKKHDKNSAKDNPEKNKPVEHEETGREEPVEPEKKYSEGTALSEKLKRDGFSSFDYNSAIEGVDPQDKIRENQSREDEAYSILKSGKKE